MAFRDLFTLRARTPAQQRDHVRVVVFTGAVVGILLLVVATVAVFSIFLDRFGSSV